MQSKKYSKKFRLILGYFLVCTLTFSIFLPSLSSLAKRKNQNLKQSSKQSLTPMRKGLKHHNFHVPRGIRTPVNFWKTVYSKYGRNTVLMHDTEDLSIVYSKFDVSHIYDREDLGWREKFKAKQNLAQIEREKIQVILLKLHEGKTPYAQLNSKERKIYNLFKKYSNPDKFKLAAADKRIRSQTCMKEKFQKAIHLSGTYMQQFEDIFNSYGVPVEISRLVFVESMFNFNAISKVGASGLWQFMPGTGKHYQLKINSIIDERNDPIRAAHAAAKLLRSNYEALGTWPLAINAYNSGRGTLRNAKAAMGTSNIAVIINNYRGGIYKFASRNFFPCFLAALEIANNYPKYFGEIKKAAAIKTEPFYLNEEANFTEISQHTGLSKKRLRTINIGFHSSIREGNKNIPAGYHINIPQGESRNFAKALKKISTYRLANANEDESIQK